MKETVEWGDWISPHEGRPKMGDYVQLQRRGDTTGTISKVEGLVVYTDDVKLKLAPNPNNKERQKILKWRKRVIKQLDEAHNDAEQDIPVGHVM